jgi:hypothetical protein
LIRLTIIKTARGYHKDQTWTQYDQEMNYFATIKKAKEWIKETYGKSKRSFQYVDMKNGKSKRIGYVIGFRNEDFQDGKWTKYLEQHWISFSEFNDLEI